MKRRILGCLFSITVVLGTSILGSASRPRRRHDHPPQPENPPPQPKQEGSLWSRRAALAFIGAQLSVFVSIAVLFFDQRHNTADLEARISGQLATRYQHAADQISSDKPAARIVGIRELGRLLNDADDDDYTLILRVLTDYVWVYAPIAPPDVRSSTGGQFIPANTPTPTVPTALTPTVTATRTLPVSAEIQAAIGIIGTRTRRLDLQLDLSRTDLRGISMFRLNLDHINFRGSDLRDSDLTGASLRGADLSGADLNGALLYGTVFDESTVVDAKWFAIWTIANGGSTDLVLVGVDFGGAQLRGVNLARAQLDRSDLSAVDLSEANLAQASIENANLTGANLRDADLSGANLTASLMVEAELSGANLAGASLRFARLSNSSLSRAVLAGADLRGANLMFADLRSADLSGADLRGANLRGALVTQEQLDLAIIDVTTVLPGL